MIAPHEQGICGCDTDIEQLLKIMPSYTSSSYNQKYPPLFHPSFNPHETHTVSFVHNHFCRLLSKCQLTACQPHNTKRKRGGDYCNMVSYSVEGQSPHLFSEHHVGSLSIP